MALSKIYTRLKLRSLIRELSKEVSEDAVQDPAVNEIINLNTLDLCEMLNGATQPDYGTTAVLGDAATFYEETVVTGAAYTESSRTITKAAHGLTSADIGRRVVIYHADVMGVSVITSVPTTGTFVIANSLANNLASNVSYVVLSRQSSSALDLSALKLDKVIKLVDSTHGLVPLKPAFDVENITNLSHNATEVFGYHEGESIYLFKGSGVTAWGTLTLHFYRLPNLPTTDNDYIDVKDKHIRLLVDKCVIDIFALAKMEAPSQLRESVDNRTQAIRQSNLDKEVLLRTKQRT